MTAPVPIKLPRLNHEAFQEQLDAIKFNADGMEIRTRSELKLEAAEQEMASLDVEGKEIRNELELVRKHIKSLQDIETRLEVNETDNAVARKAALATINSLRESGVVAKKGTGDGHDRS